MRTAKGLPPSSGSGAGTASPLVPSPPLPQPKPLPESLLPLPGTFMMLRVLRATRPSARPAPPSIICGPAAVGTRVERTDVRAGPAMKEVGAMRRNSIVDSSCCDAGWQGFVRGEQILRANGCNWGRGN